MNVADDGHDDNSRLRKSVLSPQKHHLGLHGPRAQETVLVCRSPSGERRPCAVLVRPVVGPAE